MNDREQRIRERAHRIWIEEGRPEGRDRAHWDMATELVAQEENRDLAKKPNPVAGGRDEAVRDQPVEPLEAVENQGDFPVLDDQADKEGHAPRRSRRRSVKSKR